MGKEGLLILHCMPVSLVSFTAIIVLILLMETDSHLVLMSVSKLASRIDVLKIITKASKPYKE